MSYEILYNKQFIKLSNGNYIPLICSGSNNDWVLSYNGREKRSREWWNIACNFKKIEMSAQEIIDNAFTNEYDQLFRNKRVGGEWITNEGWIRHLKSAIKNSLSLDQFLEYGNILDISGWKYDSNNGFSHTKAYIIKNEEDFYKAIESIEKENIKTPDNKYSFRFRVNYGDEKIKKPKVQGIKKNVDYSNGYYVIQLGDDGYFVRKTKYGYKYTYYTSHAKKFISAKLAQSFINKKFSLYYPYLEKVEIIYIQ